MPRRLMAILASTLLASAVLAACSGSDDPAAVPTAEVVVGPNGLAAAIVEDGVRIRNVGSETYYFGVFREGALALFVPCLDPERCQAVRADQAVLIPFAEITAWDAGADAAEVFFWRLAPIGDGGYRAVGLGSFIVRRG